MELLQNKKLQQFPASFKILIVFFILLLWVGYAVSLIKVYDQTQFQSAKILEVYRGAETGENVGLIMPPTFSTLLAVTHVHIFSQPMLYFLLSVLFILCDVSERKKSGLVATLFLGCLLSNASPWLIRYVSASFLWLLHVSQGMMSGSFLIMTLTILFQVSKKSSFHRERNPL